jgi:hypothetical protein
MRIRQFLAAAVLATGIGGLIVPALAQMQGGAGSPDRGTDQMEGGSRMGHGMMSRGGMSRGMMGGGGCPGMMQSMNGGDGRPNSQWRANPPDGPAPD